MKKTVNDSELGKINLKSNIFGKVKQLEINGTPVAKNADGAYEYTDPQGKKIYFGVKSGIFKGVMLNCNGRKIQLFPPLKSYEIALAFSGIAFLLLFCCASAYFGVLTANPITGLILAVLIFGFGELSSLPIAQSLVGAELILSAAALLGLVIDLAVYAGCIAAYVNLTKKAKAVPLKILIFILCYGAGAGVLIGLPYLIILIA